MKLNGEKGEYGSAKLRTIGNIKNEDMWVQNIHIYPIFISFY
jgi:hypothetical protein